MTLPIAISIIVISKNESALEYTLQALVAIATARPDVEIIVVDASEGRLDYLRSHPHVTWIDFAPVKGVRRTIPHQRNVGIGMARGEVIVFTDAGCEPGDGWLDALVAPIASGHERMVTGVALSRGTESVYDDLASGGAPSYVEECPTINLAIDRRLVIELGGFDERFDYGSDVDFAWRARDAGIAILREPAAQVRHDWGTRSRQVRRSYLYGQARARLYRRHPDRWRSILRRDPVAVVYPIFILGLPLAARFRSYPLLLLIPAARNRRKPVQTLVDHLLYGAGVLREALRRP